MKSKIQAILKDLIAIDSISSTPKENLSARYIHSYLSRIAYFQENPQHLIIKRIADDPLQREIVFALVKGKYSCTVVLEGHYDVVGIDDYGPLMAYAFSPEQLEQKLGDMCISDEARKDLESGEWLFGRGTADMKGGLAVCMACLEAYSDEPGDGCLLLLAVPDEESYSAGMRAAVAELAVLREQYGLNYKLMINPEPNRRVGGKHVLPMGSAGKCLPVILVQGKKAHIGACFDGLNPLGILAGIFQQTELSLDFSDVCEGEVTMPPTWHYFKDMKEEYDVSLPLLAGGYFSVVSFQTTAEQLLERLKQVSAQVFRDYIAKMEQTYARYKASYRYKVENNIQITPRVMTFEELADYCRVRGAEEFERFYTEQYQNIKVRLSNDELNYPQATLHIMREVLVFSQITEPLVLLSFSPPYYPSMSSKKIAGKGEFVDKCFDTLRHRSRTEYGVDIDAENYTVALSDCSYSAVDKVTQDETYAGNTPLWGGLYNIDFGAIEKLNIPSILLGPYGKEYHQMTERVHIEDLCVRLPDLMREAWEFVFREDALK